MNRGTVPDVPKRTRRRFFLVCAWLLTVMLGLLFVGVTALTLAVWAADPDDALTTPVTDLAFAGLGAAIVAGIASQTLSYRPVLGLAQALTGALALAVAGAIGNRDEPMAGGLSIAALVVLLAMLRPPPERRVPRERLDRRLLVAGVVGLAAALPLAAHALNRALDAGPSCYLGRCAQGDRFAELAAAIVVFPLLVMLAATRLPAWRLPLWTATIGAVVLGVAALLLPNVSLSPGRIGGAITLVWGTGLALFLLRHRKRKT